MVRSKSAKRFERLAHTVMILVTICIVLPFILLFMSSITSESALVRDGYSFFPKEFSIHAYKFIWDNAANVFRAYGITILVTVIGTSINVAMSALLAYPLSLKNLPGKRILNFYIFFTMLFNGGLVPTYLMYTGIFHINNTLLAYIVPALFEAAQIDGASQFQIFFKIVLPLGKPILIAMGLLSGLGYWNDWTNGLYYIRDTKLYGIQNLLNKMISDLTALTQNASGASTVAIADIPSASVRMAIAFVAMLPILCLYPFLQRYFTKGIALGAVKG